MRKFIFFFFITGSSLFCIDRGLTFIFDFLYSRTKTGQTGGRINYYLLQPSTPQLVIMGNSRALYQVIPDSFKISTYNLSHAGMGQIFQTGLVSILSDHRKMPPVILLHLEPEEFIGNQLNDDIQNLKFYYSKNELVTSYLANLSYFEKFKFYFHSYRYNGRVITLVKNYFQTLYKLDEGNGYSPIKRSDRDSVNTLYSIKNISAQIEGRFNLEQWNFFEKFLMICKQNNTKVICFTSPVYKNFNSYPKTMKTIDSLMERHRIQYINYLKYPIEILDEHPGLWRDRQHLNHDGARIESGYLAGAVNEILSLKDSVK